MLKTVLDWLREADAFPDDWRGWAMNQAAHFAFPGVPMALLLLCMDYPASVVPFVVAGLYGAVWEVAIQRGKLVVDSIVDTAMVALGAAVLSAAWVNDGGAAVAFYIVFLCGLAAGIWRRL